MFESLALENPRNTTRKWTTAASFALQTAGLAMLILAPIGYTEAVAPRLTERLVAPIGMPSGDTESAPPAHEHSATPPVPYHETQVVYVGPDRNIHPYTNNPSNAPVNPDWPYVPGGTNLIGNVVVRNLLEGIGPRPQPAPPTNAHSKPLPISRLDPGMLIKQVQPVYPSLAKAAHVQGKVILLAVINTQGRITHLRALSGHPLLIPAAIDAVQQWRYRPYILNDNPVEVETQITVNFTMQN